MNQQKIIQSKINSVEARIKQYKESDCFSELEKEKLISKEELELEKLLTEQAKPINVESPEQL